MGTFYEQELTPLAVDCLSNAEQFLEESEEDTYRWMWVTLTVHHSLYAFCIACLHDNDPSFALNKKGTETIGFQKALQRIQEVEYMRHKRMGVAQAIELTREQERNIEELHRNWRNYFVHFRDYILGKIIDRSYVAKDIIPFIRSALEAIELLGESTVVPFYRYDRDLRKRTKSLLTSIFSLLEGEVDVNQG